MGSVIDDFKVGPSLEGGIWEFKMRVFGSGSAWGRKAS